MFSATSEYALRALIELARLETGELVLGKVLSATAGIPSNYLSKILSSLRQGGIIAATRGVNGGYQLNKPAGDIFLIDVIEIFEGLRSRPACVLDRNKPCSDESPCPAHNAFRRVHFSYVKFLEETSIAAIARQE
jgi:Rrf2 family protein